MSYMSGTNVPPRYEYGRLDSKGKFQLVDFADPTQAAQGRYIKISKGIPARLDPYSERGIKQRAKRMLRKDKLERLHGYKVS